MKKSLKSIFAALLIATGTPHAITANSIWNHCSPVIDFGYKTMNVGWNYICNIISFQINSCVGIKTYSLAEDISQNNLFPNAGTDAIEHKLIASAFRDFIADNFNWWVIGTTPFRQWTLRNAYGLYQGISNVKTHFPSFSDQHSAQKFSQQTLYSFGFALMHVARGFCQAAFNAKSGCDKKASICGWNFSAPSNVIINHLSNHIIKSAADRLIANVDKKDAISYNQKLWESVGNLSCIAFSLHFALKNA